MARRTYAYRVVVEVDFANGVGKKKARFELILNRGISKKEGRRAAESAVFNYFYRRTSWFPGCVRVIEHEAFTPEPGAERVVHIKY